MIPYALHEEKQHGTQSFPVEYYYLDRSHPRYVMPSHWHKEWELIYVRQGSITFNIDQTEYTVCAGDSLLIGSGSIHGCSPESGIYECLVFDLRGLFRGAEQVKKHLRPFYRQEYIPPVFFSHTDHPVFTAQAEMLMNICNKGRHIELPVLGGLCNLFGYLLSNSLYAPGQEPLQSADTLQALKRVLEFIELHFQSEITLKTLSDVAAMNPNYFCLYFKRLTGSTPMEYLTLYRIEHAAVLLLASDISVMQAALEAGFNDPSYFIRIFKRYKGVTPKRYQLGHHHG